MTSKKFIILFLALVPLLVLDLWSKMWAESHLATAVHPFGFEVGSDENEQTLQVFLTGHLGEKSDEDWTTFSQRKVLRLTSRDEVKEDGLVFPENGAPPRALFVFARDRSKEIPPRALWINDHRELTTQLREENPGLSGKALRARIREALSEKTFSQYIEDRIPYASADEGLQWMSEGRVYAYQPSASLLSSSDLVKEGELYVVLSHKIPVIEGFLQFTYAENPGAAWGFLGDAPPTFRHIFFTVISIIAVLGMGWMMRRLTDEHTLYLIAFGTMLSGAIGNFVDRMRFRYVIDFIDMYIGNSHWPTYNVADIAISIGFGLIVLDLLFLTKGKGVFDDEPAEEPA